MRKYIFPFRIAFIGFLAFVQINVANAGTGDDHHGINFRSITFEQALVAAKTEKKSVFVHGYTDWCEYCKYMKDSVYPQKDVGDFYNVYFISIRMDMEKEGKEMNKILKAHTFPTLLFYDANGEMMHRAAGRKYKLPFLELGKEALDTNRQMRAYKHKYDSGTETPFEAQYYFRMQEVAGMDAQLMLDEYLRKQSDSDFTSLNNWEIIYNIVKDPTLPVMKRIIANKQALAAKYGADSVNHKIINLYNTYLMHYVQLLDSVNYEAAKRKILQIKGLDLAEKICAFADLNKSKMKSDWKAYKIEGKNFVEKYAMNDYRRLNDVAKIYHERFYTDKESMAVAEQWALRSVSLSDQYKGNYVLALISTTLGKKEQALKAINRAIELAKPESTDYRQAMLLRPVIEKLP